MKDTFFIFEHHFFGRKHFHDWIFYDEAFLIYGIQVQFFWENFMLFSGYSVKDMFSAFCHMVGSHVMKSMTKNTSFFVHFNEGVGEFRSTPISFIINLCAQPISYHNQYSLTQPYRNLLLFPLIFCPNEICLIVGFTFILLTCNNTKSLLTKTGRSEL